LNERVELGRFPTPVRRLAGLPFGPGELWVKDDARASPIYGGNKVRKLERSLGIALARGAKRIVTVGAAGSHHVLATAAFARRLGLEVLAVLCPQPWSEHAEETLRLSLAQGLEVRVARAEAWVPVWLAREIKRGDYVLPPGGSNVAGTLAFAEAMHELAAQVAQGELPEPDVIVAALGSGGTVGGILAGVIDLGLPTRVVGVAVARGRVVSTALGVGLAVAVLARTHPGVSIATVARALTVDSTELGEGYGYPTPAGQAAIELAKQVDLELDATYTAKAFSAALRMLGCRTLPPKPATGSKDAVMREFSGRPLRILYWHTLSAAPALLAAEAGVAPLPARLRALLPRG
jgi:1-aminocyclopropane-1-carboxylate deaminase/D-cysteine desulfhydrase-like pyridoxal-dependent ACC family enzyme